jgi:hypothetical protein
MTLVRPNIIAYGGIAVIVIAIVLGPFFSPPEFSWVKHSTSEQAGQGMPGAGIMRVGFFAYGSGTIVASLLDWRDRPWVRAALVMFGAGLIGTGLWSNASILPDVLSDMNEDRLHSIASGVVGTAFAAACAARLFAPDGDRRDWLSWLGLIAAVAIPLVMVELPEFRGLLQRIMFALSFVFVAREFALPKSSLTLTMGRGSIEA